ncbi:ESX secretion-associated protein EspG [Nocardia vermiculata]|uniref:ESX secretion-associated protein EspG n=1 Tax=Nocardia vermiculata TaxID=257274 RepID=A0A846XW90_9NOCA|nr:ESX secretion-associated protein EspG [Nocardia vermiculata]NKY49935.1 ESX secretion-associated protein EspG [Nocardia vermiculata]
MTVLGAGRGPSMLDAVVLSLDEMQFLLEKLEIDEVPVVLDAIGRYDNVDTHDAAMAAAAESLTARELLVDDEVHRDLEDRLRGLYRPHWAIALRWYIGERVNRFCLAKGDDMEVIALRGPDSYTIDEAGHDLPGTIMAALGAADPLELSGMNVLTEELKPILADAGDAASTAQRLSRVGRPPRDAQTLASALVEIHSHASIVGVVYNDASRDVADGMIAVYNTRNGRFIAVTTRSEDEVMWTSLAGGTSGRLRTALKDLIDKLPLRADFDPTTPGLS